MEYPTYTNGGNQGEGSLDKYIPYIKLSADKPMKFYGDENVGIFFNTKMIISHIIKEYIKDILSYILI